MNKKQVKEAARIYVASLLAQVCHGFTYDEEGEVLAEQELVMEQVQVLIDNMSRHQNCSSLQAAINLAKEL